MEKVHAACLTVTPVSKSFLLDSTNADKKIGKNETEEIKRLHNGLEKGVKEHITNGKEKHLA